MIADHPDMVVFLLDNNASIVDNEIGQNCLDVAINRRLQDCAYAIGSHERYRVQDIVFM